MRNPARLHPRARLYGLLALLAFVLSASAQQISKPTVPGMPGEDTDLQNILGRFPGQETPGATFFEGPIDPNEYIVGPGDRLKLYFWQPRYTEYSITVNGEGEVAVPLVGTVQLANLTLAEARTRIEDAVTHGMRVGRVTVSLIEPRKFRVHVTGMVMIPGTYVVSATARAADAVAMAGGLKQELRFAAGDTVAVVVASQRRILLRDPAGRERRADLYAFTHGGRLGANPYLRDGETIYVPAPDRSSDQIGVFGAVNEGGLFEYLEGDELADALAVAGGLKPSADSSSLVVVGANGTESKIDLRVNPALALTRPMNPGDRVYLSSFPDTSRNGSVTVVGEVARPGGYSIRVGETTLREIIQRAGGLLPSAAANSGRLIRHMVDDPVASERGRIIRAAYGEKYSPYPADPGLAAEFSRWTYGTTVVDLQAAAHDGSADGDITLHDGDSLEVPRGPIGVRVLGAVNKAGEIEWQPDKKLNYYLAEAGGTNKSGWKRQTIVVKARNGSQLRYESDMPIDPGDVIYVPLKPGAQTNWDIFKDFIAVAAQVATVVLVVQSIGN